MVISNRTIQRSSWQHPSYFMKSPMSRGQPGQPTFKQQRTSSCRASPVRVQNSLGVVVTMCTSRARPFMKGSHGHQGCPIQPMCSGAKFEKVVGLFFLLESTKTLRWPHANLYSCFNDHMGTECFRLGGGSLDE